MSAHDDSAAGEARRVLVTHADEPIGQRLVKTLYYDEDVARIVAVGSGPPPRSFDRFLATSGERVTYNRVDLARHRSVNDLFHSRVLRRSGIDSVVFLPRHGPSPSGPSLLGGIADRTAEARLVLQHCLDSANVRSLVAVGSAFVYRLLPGNANRFAEDSELNLDPGIPAELRTWVDCDMLFHGEMHSQKLRVTLLRAPTVVASGGYVFLHPSFTTSGIPNLRPAGFDPMCALISDKDVARAAQRALHAQTAGVFNVSGREAVPLSVLAQWTGRGELPVPGPLLGLAARAIQLAGAERLRTSVDGPQLRYGFTLDTRRAERKLGFRPRDRIGLSRAGDGRLRLEAAPA